MALPDRDDCDGVDEWVKKVVSGTDIPEEVVWEIIDEFKPGTSAAASSEKKNLLSRLLKHHTEYMAAYLEAHGEPDTECRVQLFVDNTVAYEFLHGTHNVVGMERRLKEEVSDIVSDEAMDIQHEDKTSIAALLTQGDVEEHMRVINRILEKIYGSGIDDVERAIEVRGQEDFSWTEKQRLNDRIDSATDNGGQIKQYSSQGTLVDDLTDVEQEKDYGSWIFCQSCGDRIGDPEIDPCFCPKCRG